MSPLMPMQNMLQLATGGKAGTSRKAGDALEAGFTSAGCGSNKFGLLNRSVYPYIQRQLP